MFKISIDDWKRIIERKFKNGEFEKILVGNKSTSEISNLEICLQPENNLKLVPPPVEEEIVEREFVFKNSLEQVQILLKDKNSRQCAFVNNYDGEDNHCISYFHFFIRGNKLSMNVYVRSMNFKRNFVFDCQTFNLAYRKVFDELKKEYRDLSEGYIRAFIFSLHVYL